ncbi:MAG TPA: CinA family protein [Bdellovibrionota bacterium]|nr:CinA family protein [Bdellovibrionota bacterium]
MGTTKGSSAKRLLRALAAKHGILVTVESCTGGGIADLVTGIPGSSETLWGSLVTYQDSAKRSILGIPASLLRQKGAVSRETAKAMAEAGYRLARRSVGRARALVCVSTTGVAGPGGGTPSTPVGTCYIGVASGASRGKARVIELGPGKSGRASRAEWKRRFARRALEEALREARRR